MDEHPYEPVSAVHLRLSEEATRWLVSENIGGFEPADVATVMAELGHKRPKKGKKVPVSGIRALLK